LTVFASVELMHFTVEISGQGCELLHEQNLMGSILSRIHDRVTRIDIACDIETKTKPREFVSAMKHERMRSSGYQQSSTGETCYVGSQKSERYARVYRYNAPHPREHLLRIEHVFRRKDAKHVAYQCVENDLQAIAQACAVSFGWGHSDWQTVAVDDINLSPISGDRKGNNTVFWLVHSCASAFKRQVKNGTIKDPQEFLTRYFLTDN